MSDKPPIAPSLAAEMLAEFEKEWRKELRRSIPVKDRMKIGRQPMPQRPAAERNRDFDEVNSGLGPEEAMAEARLLRGVQSGPASQFLGLSAPGTGDRGAQNVSLTR